VTQLSLLAGPPPAARNSDTSVAAAESVAAHTPRLRGMVLEVIRAAGGLTCDEVEERLDLKHQTVSARVHELMKLGQIVDGGRRKTRSGRAATVWVAR
jgi:predicted transcriptional regulator